MKKFNENRFRNRVRRMGEKTRLKLRDKYDEMSRLYEEKSDIITEVFREESPD